MLEISMINHILCDLNNYQTKENQEYFGLWHNAINFTKSRTIQHSSIYEKQPYFVQTDYAFAFITIRSLTYLSVIFNLMSFYPAIIFLIK